MASHLAGGIAERPAPVAEDEPTEETRYGIYVADQIPLANGGYTLGTRRIAECERDSIGCCLVTLRTDDPPQITNDDRVGILDRIDRKWIVNPFGVGRKR